MQGARKKLSPSVALDIVDSSSLEEAVQLQSGRRIRRLARMGTSAQATYDGSMPSNEADDISLGPQQLSDRPFLNILRNRSFEGWPKVGSDQSRSFPGTDRTDPIDIGFGEVRQW